MLAELKRALAADQAEPFRRAAHSLKSNANTFGALALGALARELELGGLDAGRQPAALNASTRPTSAPPLRSRSCAMADLRHGPARLLVADDNKVNRLLLTRSLELQGHSVASAENGRVALEMLRAEASTWCCSTWKCRRWTASRCSSNCRRPAAARPAGHRDLVARRRRQHRPLHRARRRGLPAEAGQPGAAEGAHRRQPREEAPARPAEGTGAPLRHAGGRAGPAAVGLRARRPARARLGDVLRHPRLHRRWSNRSRPKRRSSCSTPTTR